MNELDSELVAGALTRLGYVFTDDPEQARVVLYNTCSVRQLAEQKVWSRLGEMAIRKKKDPALVVGVLGCMAERDGADLIHRMPVVDVMCGPGELDKLPGLLDNAVRTNTSLTAGQTGQQLRSAKQIALQGNASRRSSTLSAAQDTLELLDLSRSISPVDSLADGLADTSIARTRSAYVRITRGCNKFCTYCVVPFTRGAEVHRPPEHILDECKKLADAGVVEITLLGQTVNHYRFEHGAAVCVDGIVQPQKGRSYKGGHDRDPFAGSRVTTFADLLARIHDEVPAIKRLRFVTSYPRDFGNDVLEVIRDHPRICRYLHVPAQTGSNRLLAKMNRGYTIEEYDEFLDRAREYLDEPEIGRPLMLSGDIIVGFPTETDEDFEATVGLLTRAQYKNCFIFKYSPRPGTVAFDKIPDDVPDTIKRQRNNDLLAVQAKISDTIARAQVGREVDIFIEGLSKQQRKRQGLTYGQIRKTGGAVTLTVSGQNPDTSSQNQCDTHNGHEKTNNTESAEYTRTIRNGDGSDAPSRTLQLSGRTDGDLIVFLDVDRSQVVGPDSLIGQIVRVRITHAEGLSLQSQMLEAVGNRGL